MAAVRARKLRKRFGDAEILKGVDLEVERGEIFGLIGPSGSGKSTLMRTLTGYLSPSAGEAEILGAPPAEFGKRERRRVGFMPQGFVLYGQLSVRQNLNFVAGLYDLSFRAVGSGSHSSRMSAKTLSSMSSTVKIPSKAPHSSTTTATWSPLSLTLDPVGGVVAGCVDVRILNQADTKEKYSRS